MATLTLQPSAATGKDTYIDSGNPTFNYGVSTTLATTGASPVRRAFLQFDLSTIPANAIITSAILTLTNIASSGSPNIDVNRITTVWFEGSQNGAAPTAGQDGSTYNLRNANGSLTYTAGAGGDIGALIGTRGFASFVAGGANDIDLTTEVQGIFAGTITNNGWAVITGGSLFAHTWASSDHATAASRPKLVITYRSEISGAIAATSTTTGTLSVAGALSFTLQPDATDGEDVTIRSSSPSFNYGLSSVIGAGVFGGGIERGLIKFDLSLLPAGATVVHAVLRLTSITEDSSTDRNVAVHRSLVEWYEGNQNNVAPGIGENASTWSRRNANGAISWTGGSGGAAGTEYETVATDTILITETNPDTEYSWNVTADLQYWQLGNPNYGWWIRGTSDALSRKNFHSSDSSTASARPQLTVYYFLQSLEGESLGTAVVTGTLRASGRLEGSAAGVATVEAQIITNFFSVGHTDGTSTVSGTLVATGRLQGSSFGDSTAVAHVIASYHSSGSADGTSSHVAHLKGVFHVAGLSEGVATAVAHILVKGQIQGLSVGSSTAEARGYARAVAVATVIGCNPVPLLHITDGSTKLNGQLNILNFLNDRAGYFLVNYKPQIAQYKDNGYWSASPQSNGRRLRGKVFDNVIDVVEVSARAGSQDALIQYQQDLMDFQEAASDYWANDYSFLPFYLVARAARETNTRYALIHMISCPELENPFTQPFFDDAVGATFVSLTIRIEHGLWWSTPPGRFDCVEVSGEREWTVSGWQTGV